MDLSAIQPKVEACLSESESSAAFIESLFELLNKAQPKINFAALSKKMGFSSRSFVRQLFHGQKKLNLKNYRQFAIGVDLSADAVDYLALIIERESHLHKDDSLFEKNLDEKRKKLQKSRRKNTLRSSKKDLTPFKNWPFIYASLGTAQNGKHLNEIVEMSGQTRRDCIEILDYMEEKNLIAFNRTKQSYHAKNEMIDVAELTNAGNLKYLFKKLSQESTKRIDQEIQSEYALFHSSVFSVRKSDLPQLTTELQRILFEFASKAENAEGDTLAVFSSQLSPFKSLE